MVTPATIAGALQKGTHAARPAANEVSAGTLYACSDHGLIYQSSGTAWSTWAEMVAGAIAPTLTDVLTEGNETGGTNIYGGAGNDVSVAGGTQATASRNGRMSAFEAVGTAGGNVDLTAGDSTGTATAGSASIAGGGAAGGGDFAEFTAYGGANTANGKAAVYSDGSAGTAGQVFTADGAGTATWEDASGGVAASAFDLTPSGDTFLHAAGPTSAQGAGTTIMLAEASGYFKFPVLTFDLSSLAGKQIVNARLRLVTVGDGSIGYNGSIWTGFIGVKRVLRAVNTATATWNIYDTGLNWSGNGVNAGDADGGTCSVAAWLYGSNGVNDHILLFDMTAAVQEAIDAGRTSESWIMRASTTTGGGGNAVFFHSLEGSTALKRPRLIGTAIA